jgi:hypothetical protein
MRSAMRTPALASREAFTTRFITRIPRGTTPNPDSHYRVNREITLMFFNATKHSIRAIGLERQRTLASRA